jgi:hypothetical protein
MREQSRVRSARVLLGHHVHGGHRQKSFRPPVAKFGNLVDYRWQRRCIGTACPSLRGAGHEIVVRLCRALGRRCLVDCLAVGPRSIANRNTRRRPASHHYGRCAEAGLEATQAEGGGKHRGISPGIVSRSSAIVDRSNARGCARSNIKADCQAGESRHQLQRWLRNKLQIRQCPLGRM